jgi:septum formation protein
VTRLLLASASPGRLATLRRAGVEPLVQVSGVDEELFLTTAPVMPTPAEAALLLARAKAEAVATAASDVVVVGCDSVLELDGAVHGKPRDAAEATARWRAMRGRSGVLHSGHWVVDRRTAGHGGAAGAVASTTVHFADVTDDEIGAYVATGEPLHVAGGFTVDGLGGAFVDGVEGDHHNVVGLSLPLLRRLLADLGVRWTDLWS